MSAQTVTVPLVPFRFNPNFVFGVLRNFALALHPNLATRSLASRAVQHRQGAEPLLTIAARIQLSFERRVVVLRAGKGVLHVRDGDDELAACVTLVTTIGQASLGICAERCF